MDSLFIYHLDYFKKKMNYKYSFISILLLFVSCSHNDQFIIYENSNFKKGYIQDSSFELYFDEKLINHEFEEVAILATDTYYYGNFFFDTLFMNALKKKVISLGGNGAIYDKNKIDYPDYNQKYLYFRVINVKKD